MVKSCRGNQRVAKADCVALSEATKYDPGFIGDPALNRKALHQ